MTVWGSKPTFAVQGAEVGSGPFTAPKQGGRKTDIRFDRRQGQQRAASGRAGGPLRRHSDRLRPTDEHVDHATQILQRNVLPLSRRDLRRGHRPDHDRLRGQRPAELPAQTFF